MTTPPSPSSASRPLPAALSEKIDALMELGHDYAETMAEEATLRERHFHGAPPEAKRATDDALDAFVAARASLDAALRGMLDERDALARMLETATVRLGILRDRMAACDDDRGPDDDWNDRHGLSLVEISGWIEEQSAARAARPEASADA